MESSSTSLSTPVERPSKLRAFMGGFGSGAVNGGLMMGMFSGVALLLKFTAPLFFSGLAPVLLPVAMATVLTTGLFSGMMGVKRAVLHNGEHTQIISNQSPVLVPTMGQSMVPQMDIAQETETASGQSWTNRVGKTDSKIDQILANGSMADKDRASAILAAREQSQSAGASVV